MLGFGWLCVLVMVASLGFSIVGLIQG